MGLKRAIGECSTAAIASTLSLRGNLNPNVFFLLRLIRIFFGLFLFFQFIFYFFSISFTLLVSSFGEFRVDNFRFGSMHILLGSLVRWLLVRQWQRCTRSPLYGGSRARDARYKWNLICAAERIWCYWIYNSLMWRIPNGEKRRNK